jgi:hypothetical protein
MRGDAAVDLIQVEGTQVGLELRAGSAFGLPRPLSCGPASAIFRFLGRGESLVCSAILIQSFSERT